MTPVFRLMRAVGPLVEGAVQALSFNHGAFPLLKLQVGFFLVEDAVQRQAGGSADQGLDVVAQVRSRWLECGLALLRPACAWN